MIKPIPCFFALTFTFSSLSAASSALAQTELHPIVTASRIAQTADQTLSAVTVITRADIRHSQSQSVAELLRNHIPGMDFMTTGGTGHQTSIFLRGTNSDHVLFMIDGNIIGSATTGAAQIELIPLEQIERIEVVRGPRSSLYGSEAIGGVIQVFTRSGGDSTNASVTLGSHSTHAASAGINMGSGQSQFGISASHYNTDGFNVTNDSENDDDGYTSNSVNLHFKHNFGAGSNIHARLLRAEGNTEFDNNSYNNESDSIQQSVTVGIDSALNESWQTSLDLGQSRDQLDTQRYYEDFFTPGSFIQDMTLFETQREQLRWQNEIAFSQTGQFAFGIDYLNDEVESTTSFFETSRHNKALYALLQNKFSRHQLQVSGRADANQAFGVHRTANAAWAYDITGNVLLNLSHGTAFIAPSFNDLYYVDPFFSGNPNLSPETSRSTELGFSGNHGWGDWSLRAYHTEIENLIVLNSSFTSVENAGQAEINGSELEIGGKLAGWNSRLSLAVIDPVNKSTGTVLQSRAKQTLKLNMSQSFAGYRLGANLLAQSSRFANASNTVELPGYSIIDLVVEKPLSKHWTLETRLDNVLDKEYATSIDFYGNTTNNTPISLFVTLSYLN